jgi:hypothetical protein
MTATIETTTTVVDRGELAALLRWLAAYTDSGHHPERAATGVTLPEVACSLSTVLAFALRGHDRDTALRTAADVIGLVTYTDDESITRSVENGRSYAIVKAVDPTDACGITDRVGGSHIFCGRDALHAGPHRAYDGNGNRRTTDLPEGWC